MQLAKTAVDTSACPHDSLGKGGNALTADVDSSVNSQKASSAVLVRVIDNEEDWRHVEPAWRELFEASPAASPVLQWEWLWEWWQTYGPVYSAPRGLRLLTVWRGDCLLGVLPLYQCRQKHILGIRCLKFLSTGEAEFEETCPNYLDLLYRKGEATTCVEALRKALLQPNYFRWDELYLRCLSEKSPLLAWTNDFVGRHQAFLDVEGTCTISEIDAGLSAYLGRLSAATRYEARRLLRAAKDGGARLEVAQDGTGVEAFYEQMIDLHQKRWTAEGRSGCFAAPRFSQFHRTLAHQLVPRGRALLARLVLADMPLAVIYGYMVGSKFDSYLSGVCAGEAGPVRSPGTAGHLFVMEYLAKRGITHYDYLCSSGPSYKTRFGTEEQRLVRLRVRRRSVRAAAYRLPGTLAKAFRKSWRVLCGRGLHETTPST